MSYNDSIRTRLDDAWGTGTILGPDGLPAQSVAEDQRHMRNRSRHLTRNNALASSVLQRSSENVIGTGIRLRSTAEGIFKDKINDRWKRLVDGKLFDVRRTFSFDHMQDMNYTGSHRDGDSAWLLIDRGYGPETQLLEGDAFETPPGYYDRNIVDGVEFGPSGAPVAYWVSELGPGRMRRPKRLLARDVIFMPRTGGRYNVTRGIPSFYGLYSLFEQIIGVLDAAVVAMRVGASQALIVTVKGKRPTNARDSIVLDAAGNPVRGRVIEPGMINIVYEGESVTSFNPQHPGTNFTDAIRTFCRFVGLRFGLTLERVLLDFTKANYSVSRSTALQEQRTSDIEQWHYNASVFARLWPWLVSKWVKASDWVGPVPNDAWAYEWTPTGRPLTEPSKDAPGIEKLIAMGIEDPISYLTERGMDPAVVCQNFAIWNKLRAENGLPPIGVAGAAGTTPLQLPEPDDDEDEEDEEDDADADDEETNR
ncbi:MAG TPA: phage portal protein [Tepidisphaeraceae bacterium]|jgi:capsid protein|nr:phage portal protein [Tepidisphaeraceae bacterium]